MPAFFTHEQKVKGVAVGKGARNAAMDERIRCVYHRRL